MRSGSSPSSQLELGMKVTQEPSTGVFGKAPKTVQRTRKPCEAEARLPSVHSLPRINPYPLSQCHQTCCRLSAALERLSRY